MTEQIVSKDMIRQKARGAYLRGVARDGHGMNPGAPAIETWQAEWDKCHQAENCAFFRQQADTLRTDPAQPGTNSADELSRALFAMVRS